MLGIETGDRGLLAQQVVLRRLAGVEDGATSLWTLDEVTGVPVPRAQDGAVARPAVRVDVVIDAIIVVGRHLVLLDSRDLNKLYAIRSLSSYL